MIAFEFAGYAVWWALVILTLAVVIVGSFITALDFEKRPGLAVIAAVVCVLAITIAFGLGVGEHNRTECERYGDHCPTTTTTETPR